MPRGIARDHEEKRAAIRKGAADYFAEHGFDRASMTGAAKHCGVSKALIYHYYDSKEALLFDILDTHLSTLVEEVEAAPETDGLRGLVRAILVAYKGADAEHKLQLDALSVLEPELQNKLFDLQRRLIDMMGDALRAAAPDSLANGAKLRPVTMSVFGILNWYYMWNRPGQGLSREEYADLVTDMLLGGLNAL
ncbi:HTH-type transcriptional repressor Bm3R1 [Aliiroseovarius sp. xm-m-379]|uniref:TetR/AcrR family transcriptional regulator n=1 Tax=Aliiroseovarius TaxID=1658781 RepID=UPI001568CBB5|nr:MULTISPECIES: TetR/AcrR family transcriptional regulator [Aliiroseovarius]NRP13802.1 HTH-type transcriptional repressor Bm3R1 [Aliiroseovarius sp. xm-d-517]NRP25553.1 HTH-type transcriptional repressor Bm3R1 [Aliiroseovarius sp. xm-m-379]NRP29546.1 HTH-type transcriptional repressor Bm3R1 [Aliiroseovarius sp. xm-m-314]NRP34352.1 HTH-type transcriptional repressor Bm3R1 [Aliiroseovarius sp. xm-a-104]NRP41689.1 HTH-type transcriptional repressor Bm3R1 [Aliiroseovarius sp. xm-m-339-2]